MTEEKIPVDFTGVRVTALVELYARWLDARDRHPILADPWADRVVRRLGFDHSEFKKMGPARFAVGVRSRQMDDWIREYLAAHRDAVVLDLGSGFDSRVFRIDPPPGHHWYDLDFPDVIAIRDRLYPRRDDHTSIGASVLDTGWLEQLPDDRPVIVVADGFLGFLSEDEVRQVFRRIVDHFPEGQMVFNTYAELIKRRARKKPVPLFKKYGIAIDWTLEVPEDVEKLEGRLHYVDEKSQVDTPLLRDSALYYRLMCAVIRAVPSWKYSGRVLRYRFP